MGICALCCKLKELTGEHIIAAWIGRLVGPDVPGTISYYDYLGENTVERSDYADRGGHKNCTIPVLCGPCNSEWSNRIQEETRKFLKPVLEGERRFLSATERQQLAIWMSLFIIVRQFLHPKLAAICEAQRLTFRNSVTNIRPSRPSKRPTPTTNGSPLPGIKVWIAPFEGTENNFASYYTGFRIGDFIHPDAGPDGLNAYMSIAAFGNTLIFALGGNERNILNMCTETNIAIGQILRGLGLTQVWPNYSSFPLTSSNTLLTDQDFESIPTIIQALLPTLGVDSSINIIPIYGEPLDSSYFPRRY